MNQETSLAQRIQDKINPAVTGQTKLAKNGGMDFSTVEQIMEFAKIMAIAGCAIPKHLRESPGACLAVAIQACEWSMSPFAVANKSYVVNDRIAYESQLVNAVILMRAPIKGRFAVAYSGSGQSRRCKVSATLQDGGAVEYESPMFSEITTKNSPLWKADPDQQLFYYSSRAMCRRHFPDVILGIYTADELQDREEESRFERAKPVILTPVDAPQFTAPAAKTPDPADAPPGAEVPVQTSAQTPQPQSAPARDLKSLRGLLKLSGFSELHLLNYLRSSGAVDDSLGSLEDVAELQPSALKAACDTWSKTVLPALKSAHTATA